MVTFHWIFSNDPMFQQEYATSFHTFLSNRPQGLGFGASCPAAVHSLHVHPQQELLRWVVLSHQRCVRKRSQGSKDHGEQGARIPMIMMYTGITSFRDSSVWKQQYSEAKNHQEVEMEDDIVFFSFQVEKIMKGSSLSRYFNYTTVFAFGYVDPTLSSTIQ